MKLNFVVRESKVGKNGTAPLELSVTINGERKVFALDMRCNPSKWDAKNQKVKGSKEINDYINVIRSKGKRLMLPKELQINPDKIIRYLNIKAKVILEPITEGQGGSELDALIIGRRSIIELNPTFFIKDFPMDYRKSRL